MTSSRAVLMTEERRRHYREHRNRVGEALYRCVLRAQATIEAAQMCNDLFERDGLLDVGYDLEEIGVSVETVLRAEMNAILVKHARLPRSAQVDFIARVIARMAPRRDGPTAPLGPRPQAASPARRPDLGGQIRREAERLFGENR